jgi:hypothetical protein
MASVLIQDSIPAGRIARSPSISQTLRTVIWELVLGRRFKSVVLETVVDLTVGILRDQAGFPEIPSFGPAEVGVRDCLPGVACGRGIFRASLTGCPAVTDLDPGRHHCRVSAPIDLVRVARANAFRRHDRDREAPANGSQQHVQDKVVRESDSLDFNPADEVSVPGRAVPVNAGLRRIMVRSSIDTTT